MTLIVSLANKDYAAQISDRRLSSDGKLVDDESNKCGILFCLNARMAFGYTGLALWRGFKTQKWLLKALHHSASPDYIIGEILERLKDKATDTFKNNPNLKYAPKEHKRLAIMFTGFINLDGEQKPGCAILSNYHNFENNTRFTEAKDEFRIKYSSPKDGEKNPTLVQRVGNWLPMKNDDIDKLRSFLTLNKPSKATVSKTIEVVREIAGRPQAQGTIGKQLTSIIIPKDLKLGCESSYSSDVVKTETYMPAMVYMLPDKHMTVDNISVRPLDRGAFPMSVPKVGKNVPCSCGSGKKYKYCHGKKPGKNDFIGFS